MESLRTATKVVSSSGRPGDMEAEMGVIKTDEGGEQGGGGGGSHWLAVIWAHHSCCAPGRREHLLALVLLFHIVPSRRRGPHWLWVFTGVARDLSSRWRNDKLPQNLLDEGREAISRPLYW